MKASRRSLRESGFNLKAASLCSGEAPHCETRRDSDAFLLEQLWRWPRSARPVRERATERLFSRSRAKRGETLLGRESFGQDG
ncbi:hypothetical protein MRX96_009312 [Rhipicephalus microplus]